MKVAFLVHSCHAFSPGQRDLLATIAELQQRGHQCCIICAHWSGAQPAGIELQLAPAGSRQGTGSRGRFHRWLCKQLATRAVDCTVAFDLIPGQDICFPGDHVCGNHRKGAWWRPGRGADYAASEAEVFAAEGDTRFLFLTEQQSDRFNKRYPGIGSRSHTLPLAVPEDRGRGQDAQARRGALRESLGIETQDYLLLWAGTRAEELGLALEALAGISREQPSVVARLLVASPVKQSACLRRAKRLGVEEAQILFADASIDRTDLLLAADVLVHPATRETVGSLLPEAIITGLPVVSTDLCHYADQVIAARCGTIIRSPIDSELLLKALLRMIDGIFRADLRESALLYARNTELYSGYTEAARLIEQSADSRRQAGLARLSTGEGGSLG